VKSDQKSEQKGLAKMEKLYVLYDPKCELCSRLKDWLLVQRSWIGLKLIPADTPTARTMFPELERIASPNDLAVISDEGAVYLNDRAWIMVLYALEEYRDWAARLTHPLLMPLARQAYAALSRNRHFLSRWVSSTEPETIAAELRNVALEPCALPEATMATPNIRDYLR
jgi:predicted DCC family thiol-disulfide oxidoreductase YuxK